MSKKFKTNTTIPKKAQGISLDFIIMAAIGLIVLVVVIIIFTRQSQDTSTTLKNCFTAGGTCEDDETNCLAKPEGGRVLVSGNPSCREGAGNTNKVCCLTLEKPAA